jgi:hypothetical protein
MRLLGEPLRLPVATFTVVGAIFTVARLRANAIRPYDERRLRSFFFFVRSFGVSSRPVLLFFLFLR